jgi:hypothetical protein
MINNKNIMINNNKSYGTEQSPAEAGGLVAEDSLFISPGESSKPKIFRFDAMCPALLLLGMTGMPCCTMYRRDT